jgi:uncharacterized protein YodC (DUF2158 family)
MNGFKIGDVVQLRSGGPKMTVHSLTSDGAVACQWFEGNEVHEENFPNEGLKNFHKLKMAAADGKTGCS